MAVCPFADQSRRYDAAYPMTYSGGLWKALLHGTESSALPGYDGGAKAPHFTVVPDKTTRTVKVYQHFDTGRPSRALRNLAGGVETNRERVIQIEIVGTSDPRAAGAMILLSAAPRWLLDGLARLMRWIEQAHGIPRVSTPRPWLPYPSSYGATRARMTGPEWDDFSGWCGHQHAPENTHGDPGDIDITYLLSPTKEDDVTPEQIEQTAQRAAALVWSRIVSRKSGDVPAIQELADAKTLVLSLQGQVAALAGVVAKLAETPDLSAAQIEDAAKAGAAQAIAEGVKVTGTLSVEPT